MKKKISINDLTVGESLGQDIFDTEGRLLLKKGTVLIEELKNGLLAKGIEIVCIETAENNDEETDAKLSSADMEILKQGRDDFINFSKIYNTLLFEIRRTALRGKYNKPLQANLKEDIFILMQYLLKTNDLVCLDHYFKIKHNKLDYTYENHALNTAILGILLGKWLKLENHKILEVGLTGCLHDLGENRLPEKMLSKKGKLSAEEWELVKKHPVLGAKTLTRTEWMPPRVIIGVLRHHERLDGTGYPEGCPGSEIPLYARIIAVASIFNAMTTNRSYAKAVDIFAALDDLRNRSFGQLDAKITRILFDKVNEYFKRGAVS